MNHLQKQQQQQQQQQQNNQKFTQREKSKTNKPLTFTAVSFRRISRKRFRNKLSQTNTLDQRFTSWTHYKQPPEVVYKNKLFLKSSQYSRKKTCVGVSLE